MAFFITPVDLSKYDALAAFMDLTAVHWHQYQNKSVTVGDTIYLYATKPIQRLIVKALVVARDVNIAVSDYAKYSLIVSNPGATGPWFTLELISFINQDITLQDLMAWGIRGNVQSLRQLAASTVVNIEQRLATLPELETVVYTDGKPTKIYTTKYERNPKNRQQALDIHGYTCKACGFNFADVYGTLGASFIEVHHVVPLASLNATVKIDPQTDLVPLCANCHRMIHHQKGRVLTVAELKARIRIKQEPLR